VFVNKSAKKIYIIPSFAHYTVASAGVTVTGPAGTKFFPGAVLVPSTGTERISPASASGARKTRSYCANYAEQYILTGAVLSFGYGGDYNGVAQVYQSEDAQPYLGYTFTQRDGSSVLYSSGGGFQPDSMGGQYEIYQYPGVDPGYTVGGGASMRVTITYGHATDPEYWIDYGEGDAVVTCNS
jgi:hypothetical protein